VLTPIDPGDDQKYIVQHAWNVQFRKLSVFKGLIQVVFYKTGVVRFPEKVSFI
jgi:hypothetical protein